MKQAASALLLALALSHGAAAQTAAPARKAARPAAHTLVARPTAQPALDQLLREYVEAGKQPGAIALVAQDGKIIYRKAFGYADVAARTPLQPEAIFRIASQTKAVASVGLMLLYDEGKFQLDDPVGKYLPAFKNAQVLATFNPQDSSYTTVPAKSEITIRQLLTHTSGLGYPVIGSKEARAIYAKAGIPSGIGTPGGLLATSMDKLGRLPLLHQPGERFTYGLSVDVVGRLVEVLSGQPLDEFLRRRLFEPLGMRDTYFYLPAAKHSRLVPLYTEAAQSQALTPTPPQGGMTPDYPKAAGTYFSGGAGLSSTIDDYAAFLQMLLNGGEYGGRRLLKPATVQLMTTNQIGALEQGGNKFGLGFGIMTAGQAPASGLSEGSYEWGGIFGTTYWVDPKLKVVALLYTQKYPNTTARDLPAKFKQQVRQAVTAAPAPSSN
ncbi:class A beta-lactamase-related serine hydrolase [Hymenobacter gummosus]|uniref:Class A beta-lactamase-related serine hydrolase n=1 Tax=Hymenobacter gummosus TaxID=1776032 RepID=A0A3S0H9K4_9BACT|nr:serine hydrolase domain-containing protein [Hymenobacter gummosus]RTQ50035.1 class A beta-lactamase-related serine hydrolase [Hymenobacter gummosus]